MLLPLALLAASIAPSPAALSTPADEPPPDLNKWKGSVNLAVTNASGNTDRTTVAATAKAEKRREKDRTSLDFLWNYAEEDDSVTQRKTLLSGKYDYFVDKKLYYYGQASVENDHNAALDLRWIVGGGAGYQFREDEQWKISGEAGLSYVDENFEGSADDSEYVALRAAGKADRKVSDKWECGAGLEILQSLEDREDMLVRSDLHAKTNLSKNLLAQAQLLSTYDNSPASGADHTDHLFLLGLGWSF